jgi:hypothetical protein
MKTGIMDVNKKNCKINIFIGIDESIIRFIAPDNVSKDNDEVYLLNVSNKQLKDLGLIISEKTSVKG